MNEKDEQYEQLRREMNAQEQKSGILLKEKQDNEIKLLHEMDLLRGELKTLKEKCEASEKHTQSLELELRKLQDEKTLSLEKVQKLENEKTKRETTLNDTNAKMEKIEDDMKHEIANFKDQIQQYEQKVMERDSMIDQLRRNFKSERKYFKSDKEDEELCNNVSKLVECYTSHDVKLLSGCSDTKVQELELRIEQLTEQNNDLHVRLSTHQSPTASLMPSSSNVLREALQLNEAESTGLKEEIDTLKIRLETYIAQCKRQSEAIVKLKEELCHVKVHHVVFKRMTMRVR